MKYSTSHVTISSAHLNTYYRAGKKPKQHPTSPKKKRKSTGKKTDDSDDEGSGPPKIKKATPAKLKDSYVLQVADLATLEGKVDVQQLTILHHIHLPENNLCIGVQSYLRRHVLC
jgi:hypothetical protein